MKDTPEGLAIPFTVGSSKKHGSPIFSEAESQVILINSMVQLNEISKKDPDFFSKYNDAFFNCNVLILVTEVLSSGSFRLQADSLIKRDGELCVLFTVHRPGPGMCGTCDMAYWCVLLEVNKEDVSGIGQLSYILKS